MKKNNMNELDLTTIRFFTFFSNCLLTPDLEKGLEENKGHFKITTDDYGMEKIDFYKE